MKLCKLPFGVALVALSVFITNANADSFSYPDFSSTSGLSIIHNAGLAGATLRLTPATNYQAGAAWYTAKEYCAAGFTSTFHFQITDTGSMYGYPEGADGISFSVQNVSTDVDANEYGPALNSVGVSLNTFWNPGLEVSDNFVGICRNAGWLLQQDLNPTPIRLKDGNVHVCQVSYDGALMNITIDGLLVITNFPVSLSNALDSDGTGWVGLGARCGAVAWENQDILDWSFATLPTSVPVILAQPVNQSVLAGGNAAFSVTAVSPQSLSYQWQFNGADIADATNSSLTLSNVQTNNAGAYSVTVSNTVGSVVSSNAMLMVLSVPPAGCVTYPDFSSTNGMDLIGTASVVGGSTLRLTPAQELQNGDAWYATKQFCTAGFISTFQFRISNIGGIPGIPAGADGISFGLQNQGLNADAVEYSAVTNGFGISFNTFQNPGLEVSDNFVGICTNGSHWVMQQDLNPGPIRLKDGNVHTAVVQYDGSTISVSIDSVPVITAYPISIANALDGAGMAWVGFGGRCGGAWEDQDILNWSFCTLTNTINHQPPVADSQSVSLDENSSLAITLTATDTNGSALTYIVSRPSHGTLTGTAPNVTYKPASQYSGPDSFTFRAFDGIAYSAPATVSITVNPVIVPPIAVISASPLSSLPGITNPVVLSFNQSNALVVLDGSLSSDPNGYALQFDWSEAGVSFSTNVMTTTTLGLGPQTITLVVSDGAFAATNSITVQVVAAQVPAGCVDYADFSSTNGMDLIGTASVVDGSTLRLTPAQELQNGDAWYATKQFCAAGFISTFQFRISNIGGIPGIPAGADGISFGLQNQSLNADAVEYSAVTNGFGISFNTFQNPGLEVSDNFVGICTNGSHWVMQQDLNPGPIRLKDGNVHTAVVQYDGSAISVSIDSVPVITGYAISIANALDGNGMAWVGFGGRCGGAWEDQDILNWSFCTSTNPVITTPPVNPPPVAALQVSPVADQLPGFTGLVIISPNNTNAPVLFDASGSTGASNQPLQFAWIQGGAIFATNAVTSNTFSVGSYSITLNVSDGTSTVTTNASLSIIKAEEAVNSIIAVVGEPPLPGLGPYFADTQPLLSALDFARASFVGNNMQQGVDELAQFQSQLSLETTSTNAVLAAQLNAGAQQIIDAVSSQLPPVGGRLRMVAMVTQNPALGFRFHYTGVAGNTYTIQASTNLVDWQAVGSAVADGNGNFDFQDANSAKFTARFYRVILQ